METTATWTLSMFLGLFAGLSSGQTDEGTLALVGGTVYPSPAEEPIPAGVVVIRGGKIVEVGPRDRVSPPPGARAVACEGLHVFAGFQNSHVHFTETRWQDAGELPAERLAGQLEEMLLRYGFTTVVDTGSALPNTLALRRRIAAGEVPGPRILTAGGPLYPVDGIPFYLREALPAEELDLLNTPESGEVAVAIVFEQLEAGADLVKLFAGSWVERGRVLPLSLDIARPAAAEAHEQGKLVFAHASNVAGLEVALAAGVDVLAHALDDDRGFDESHLERMKAADMAMVPTLKLFAGQPYTKYIQQQVGDYARAGGQILFGTDVGFLTDYDPTEEYTLMAGAGLDWRAILAALTTAPSERFGEVERRGRIAAGQDADLVALSADPADDVAAFAQVVLTLRAGRVVFDNRSE